MAEYSFPYSYDIVNESNSEFYSSNKVAYIRAGSDEEVAILKIESELIEIGEVVTLLMEGVGPESKTKRKIKMASVKVHRHEEEENDA